MAPKCVVDDEHWQVDLLESDDPVHSVMFK